MYYLFIVLWFVFPVAVDSDAPTLDKLQDLREQDFEQFERKACVLDAYCTYFLVSIYRNAC
jgi:hypothetical protein